VRQKYWYFRSLVACIYPHVDTTPPPAGNVEIRQRYISLWTRPGYTLRKEWTERERGKEISMNED
jgi:hypothetical protein